MLLSLATTLNSVPLPPVSNRYGIRLPPPESARNDKHIMSTDRTDTACRDEKPKSAPVPRDARLISLILASMGIEDAEPAVLVQLLEFAHRM